MAAIGIANIQHLAEEHKTAALAHHLSSLGIAEGDKAIALAAASAAIIDDLSRIDVAEVALKELLEAFLGRLVREEA